MRTHCLSALAFVGAAEHGFSPGLTVGGERLRPRQLVAAPGARIADVLFPPGVHTHDEVVDRVNRQSGVAHAALAPDGGVLVDDLPLDLQRRPAPKPGGWRRVLDRRHGARP